MEKMIEIHFRGWRITILNKKDFTVRMTFGLRLEEERSMQLSNRPYKSKRENRASEFQDIFE